MKIKKIILIISAFLILLSCREYTKREITNYKYFDVSKSDTLTKSSLIAITDEEYLQYGSNIAFIDNIGDTIIPFGKYAYYGTDSLEYYANVIKHPNDSTWGRKVVIDRNQNILFDIVMFDNGPESFNENLTRVLRNGKMGYANKYGQVVIPCIYDYAKWFENGKAKVTLKAIEYMNIEGHGHVESDEWFEINKLGQRIN